MRRSICLAARTISFPQMGGHLWVYLNWALGLRSLGYNVVWLEAVDPGLESSGELAKILSERLDTYGIGLALRSATRTRLDSRTFDGYLDLQACLETELLINMSYGLPASVVEAFRRSALVDIDPGLTQIWLSKNELQLAPHDIYFTIGETVGQLGARFPDCGIEWHYTPPCISLDHWPVCDASLDARFTTVSNWYQEEGFEGSEGWFFNDKRTGSCISRSSKVDAAASRIGALHSRRRCGMLERPSELGLVHTRCV